MKNLSLMAVWHFFGARCLSIRETSTIDQSDGWRRWKGVIRNSEVTGSVLTSRARHFMTNSTHLVSLFSVFLIRASLRLLWSLSPVAHKRTKTNRTRISYQKFHSDINFTCVIWLFWHDFKKILSVFRCIFASIFDA